MPSICCVLSTYFLLLLFCTQNIEALGKREMSKAYGHVIKKKIKHKQGFR